ncbi:MAG TPA: aminopeptidase [Ignavibacteria bacterium]|nr:aminopeptidase [Ignavibacteria bacterium]
MKKEYIKKYCELLIKVGVNLYKGQSLMIGSSVQNSDFALELADTAYKAGAKHVEILYISNKLKKSKIDNTVNLVDLEYMPAFYINRIHEAIAGDWAFIRIDNLEEIDELKSADTEKLGIIIKKEQEINTPMSNAVSTGKICWCIVAAPGPNWAAKVFNAEPSEEITDKLSESLVKVLRLDKDDPVEEWRLLGKKLKERSDKLDALKIDKLIYKGPGTDLEIGLNKTSIWKAGFTKAQNGRAFIANIPTEEVFTTPDYKRTNGKVRVTKPVKVLENLLTGIWFEFKDGMITDFGADSKRELLEKFFATDEGAKYLGEAALVDKHSEVHKSGLIFNSILYDENAACHIALGRGISTCLTNKDELISPDEMMKNGCNYSIVHTDFMIGSDEINVTAVTQEGKEIGIIKMGEFVI